LQEVARELHGKISRNLLDGTSAANSFSLAGPSIIPPGFMRVLSGPIGGTGMLLPRLTDHSSSRQQLLMVTLGSLRREASRGRRTVARNQIGPGRCNLKMMMAVATTVVRKQMGAMRSSYMGAVWRR